MRGSLSTNACAPARRDAHIGSSLTDVDVDVDAIRAADAPLALALLRPLHRLARCRRRSRRRSRRANERVSTPRERTARSPTVDRASSSRADRIEIDIDGSREPSRLRV
jgi:hypothetical protein